MVWGGTAFLLLAVLLLAATWGQPYLQQARYVWLQNHCMKHVDPATLIVYSEEAGDIAALTGRPGYALDEFAPRTSGALVPIFHRNKMHLPLRWTGSDAALFLHHRKSRGGHDRLVGVDIVYDASRHAVRFPYMTGSLATWSPGSRLGDNSFIPVGVELSPGERIRLYAGQPDDADLSHFTIAYEINSAGGIIDGWLLDNERLRFEVRSGPAMGRLK